MSWVWFLGAYALLAAVLFFVLLRSPQGYEDDKGFHYGRDQPRPEKDDPEAVKSTADDEASPQK